ncbi:hypothetical protein SH1V18_00100 [Vallitalea longa]|uniref:Lipoprotein n=1 Tax=Vallitalea longa TaxID=2936439 RepID=A0A9W5Y7Y7_9FIRM|nr:hypothetical protein [Vallitalea longa]GKX27530.1 hypothetical protein SH1V18_00100 [Vallitalea longa]
MKKVAFIIFTTVILFCSCSKKADSDYKEFPKTNWGMSITETLNAYEISKKDTINYRENYSFTIEGYELFGEKTSMILFNFIYFEKENPKLCAVRVNYPESADMNNVLKEMKKEYGETVSNISNYYLFGAFENKLPVYKYTESDHLKLWANKKSVIESIPENQHVDYRNLWKNYQTSLRDDNWDTFSQNANMVTVVWSDNGEFPARENYALDFYAYNLVVFNEINRQLTNQ